MSKSTSHVLHQFTGMVESFNTFVSPGNVHNLQRNPLSASLTYIIYASLQAHHEVFYTIWHPFMKLCCFKSFNHPLIYSGIWVQMRWTHRFNRNSTGMEPCKIFFCYIYVNDVPWISIIDIISSPLFYFFNIAEFRPIILLSFGNFAIIDPQFLWFYAKM